MLEKLIVKGARQHIFEKKSTVVATTWFGKKCYIIWDVDGTKFNESTVATEIAGGCVLMIFPDELPDDIWYKRLIVRRKTSRDHFRFPIAAVNISTNKSFEFDNQLPKDDNFCRGLIDAYNRRNTDVFEYGDYLVGCSNPTMETELRLLSMANMYEEKCSKRYMQIMLSVVCSFMILVSIGMIFWVKTIHFAGMSLRQRIAAIFMIAMVLPVLSLISIGKTFITHEEGRLKESAYVKMRAGLEALDMRYKDTPRLIERDMFNHILDLLGKKPYTLDRVKSAMEEAINQRIIEHYVVFADHKKVASSWSYIEPTLEKMLQYMADKILREESEVAPSSSKNQIMDFVGSEIAEILDKSGGDLDFTRPSHLRTFVYLDFPMYFMTVRLVADGVLHPLFVYLSERLVEHRFAVKEFTTNNIAAQQLPGSVIIPELSFYGAAKGSPSLPDESPLWGILKPIFERSAELKIEETGTVTVEKERFLYLIKPLSSMGTQSMIPCLITSTKPIENRVREASILLFALSSLAIFGTILLSFVLSSSLLVPIKKIDSAAQQVGSGNLNIMLPDAGNDELGRLSNTFNEMVKGLREREKMQAYVSDSVLEAVKDDGDQSVHAGKHIEATILFSDVRNFTGLSEANPPEKVFDTLNEFFGGVEPIIRMNHGRVDKYIGDAVMAIFHQTSPEHHALSAIKSAVKMKEFVVEMNERRQKQGLFPIQIGIGISTGKVLLGDIGSNRRKDLTVIGDEVNLASRLESASKKGNHSKIMFSGQTYAFVEDCVHGDRMPFDEIRGKKHAVEIFEFDKFTKDV